MSSINLLLFRLSSSVHQKKRNAFPFLSSTIICNDVSPISADNAVSLIRRQHKTSRMVLYTLSPATADLWEKSPSRWSLLTVLRTQGFLKHRRPVVSFQQPIHGEMFLSNLTKLWPLCVLAYDVSDLRTPRERHLKTNRGFSAPYFPFPDASISPLSAFGALIYYIQNFSIVQPVKAKLVIFLEDIVTCGRFLVLRSYIPCYFFVSGLSFNPC